MSLLIKGVQVIDGLGSEPYKADVLVQKNIISAIGNLRARKTARVIEGLGNYLVPGFIDTHTNADHYLSLFSNPGQGNFIKQGITTIIGGHCGASLAPILYGDLISIRKWADTRDINVDWHTVSELLDSLEGISIGLNFGTLAGHSTIRRALIGDRTRLLPKELGVFKEMLKLALKDGAFGFSSGLEYVHGKSVTSKEIHELLGVVQGFGGIYTVHLRNETDKLLDSVKEIAEATEGRGVKTVISHMRPINGFEDQFEETLRYIDEAENLYFDVCPFDLSVKLIYTLLPEWAQVEDLEKMLEGVRGKKFTGLLEKDLGGINGENIMIAGAPHHEYLVGRTIADIAENLNMAAVQALIHVMDVTSLRAVVFIKNVNQELLAKTLTHKKALIVSHGNGSLTREFMVHDRSRASFPEFLNIAVDDKTMPLEKAIEKITSKPAELFGIKNRGVIKDGYVADLVLLGKNGYEVKDVIVGGKVFGHEETKGEMLRHKS